MCKPPPASGFRPDSACTRCLRSSVPRSSIRGDSPAAAWNVWALSLLISLLAANDPPIAGPEPARPAASPAPPSLPPPTIDSLLQGASGQGQTTDEEDEARTPAPRAPGPPPPSAPVPPGPTPYSDIDSKAYSDAILAAARTAQAMQGP